MPTQTKRPELVEAGRRGAAKRWGPPRIVRLDDLTPDQRRVITSLIEAQRAANTAEANGGSQ